MQLADCSPGGGWDDTVVATGHDLRVFQVGVSAEEDLELEETG